MTERFIGMMAKRYAAKHPCIYCDIEDLKQSGFFGLLDAAISFNPNAGAGFLTHLEWRLMPAFGFAALGKRGNRIKRQQLQESNALRLDSPVDDDGTMFYDLIEDSYARQAFEDVERRIFNEQLHDALEGVLLDIPAEDAELIREYFYNGKTGGQIAAERGASQYDIQLRKNKALTKLRDKIRTQKRSYEFRQYLEDMTPYYAKIGVNRFNSSHTSAVEYAVLKRENVMNTPYTPE